MDIKIIDPLITAFTDILPQVGFQAIEKQDTVLVGSTVDYDGVLVHISLVGVLKGAIMIGMSLESAKHFASIMMMGMPVSEFDLLAQSAISEMGNMICANACTQFSKIGISGLDISPPLLMIGRYGQATLPVPQTIAIRFFVDDLEIQVYAGLKKQNN